MSFTPNQLAYAKTIIDVGNSLGASYQDKRTALMVALDESDLQMYANSKVPESLKLNHENVGSDGLSVGLFQQQVGIWGDAGTLMDPVQSATLFYKALFNVPGRATMDPAQAAQTVQRSATPDGSNYAARAGQADELLSALNVGNRDSSGPEPITGHKALQWWQEQGWMQRAGVFALGASILVVAFVFMLGENKTVQAYAKTAAKAVIAE
jgi:hypothetical protein